MSKRRMPRSGWLVTALLALLTLQGLLLAVAQAAPELAPGAPAPALPSGPAAAGGKPSLQGSFSLPLPSPELADGELTVKIVGQDMSDLQVGVVVSLQAQGAAAPQQQVKTGADGRARFTELAPQTSYVVAVTLQGQQLRSEPFTPPAKGGLRLLFSLQAPGAAEAHPAVPQAPPGAAGSGGMGMGMGMGSGGMGSGAMGGGMGSGAMGSGMPDALPGQALGSGLPPGHPPVEGGSPGVGQGPRSPAQGAQVEPAPKLALRQVQITVTNGTTGKPLGSAPIWLEGKQRLGQTAADGELLLTLPEGEAPQAVAVEHAGLTYRSPPLELPAAGGLRVAFTVHDRTREAAELRLATGSHLVAQVSEGAINFMQILIVENAGKTVFVPGPEGLALPLPKGAEQVEIPRESQSLLRWQEGAGELRLFVPLPPGQVPLRVFYQLGYQGEQLEFQQRAALPTEQTAVMVMNGAVRLIGPAVEGGVVEAAAGREGVVPLRPVPRGGLLELTFAGLPHRDRTGTLALVALAGGIILWALLAALAADRVRAGRQRRREQLLDQLVGLRRIDPEGPASRRQQHQLIKELTQLWE